MINIQISANNIKLETVKDLTGCVLEIYYYDFLRGCYKNEPDLRQQICAYHGAGNMGYSFHLNLFQKSKIKCVLVGGGTVLAQKECYLGERHRVRVMEKSREGDTKVSCVYSIVSSVSLSKKVLYYQCPNSKTKITLPVDLMANEEVLFTVKSGFKPKFMCDGEFAECIMIE